MVRGAFEILGLLLEGIAELWQLIKRRASLQRSSSTPKEPSRDDRE